MALQFQDMKDPRLTRVVLIVLVVISFAMVTVYSREGESGLLHSIQSAAHAVFAPLELLSAPAGAAVEDAGEAISDASASEETLSALRERNAELTELLTQSEEYRQEAERLQGLLELKDTYEIEGVSGRVIGRSTDAWNQTVTVDIGSNNGVETGLTVVGPAGVVGQVISVQPGSSTVRLLTDPKSGAAALVQSSRAEGIVRGSLSGQLTLQNIDASVNLQVGDVVLTSGLGGSYVKGLLIGTIVRIEGSAGDGSRTIYVSPNETSQVLEEVTVIFNAKGDSSANRSSGNSGGGSSASGSAGSNGGGSNE
ncbi:rod shape-determining protein MreC [Adlercreutzia sp. ZJ304]|uniref:rod shape-determining protein MreC n=1 Tax=Adlercreutzia sp. ZJ304 TaxID=2709791 RepID=UPI0013ED1967|nr:rod shape-determining protein MreC [Adlercreutzia sp. ZJ304]